MKKIMFAAALTAGFAAFGDGIASNVVGYNTLNTGYTYQMLGSSFAGLGTSTGILLKDIDGAFQVYDEIQVAYVDNNGRVQFEVYQYLNEDEGGECEGWHNGDFEYIGDQVSIARGSAVWCISQNDAALSLTTAGGVDSSSFTHTGFTEAYTMICSAYPIAFSPNASSVTWTGVSLYDELQVAYVDSNGRVQFEVYQYLNEDEGGEGEGWHNGDFELLTSSIAAVGQGFWFITYGDPTGVSMVETSPISE